MDFVSIVATLAMSSATAGAGLSAPIPSCTSCGGSSTTGKRPSPAAIGVMPLDASRYSPSPCSYMSVQPLQGFSLQVSLCFGSTSIHSHALLESGASTCIIDKLLVRAHNIPTVRTSQPISVEVIDGQVLSLGGYRSYYPVDISSWGSPGGTHVLPHHNPLTSDCIGAILVGDTQSDGGLV